MIFGLAADRDHLPPLVPSSRVSDVGHASTPTPGSKSHQPIVLSDLDPDTLPRDFKREGHDWSVIWNPKSKRQLDIKPVYTLIHESVVCCVRFSNDGKYLATGCNRTAQIYDTLTGFKSW